MMKKSLKQQAFLVGLMVFASVLSSCKSKNELTFGLLLPSFNDEYFVHAKQYFEQSITEMGGKVITYDGQNNESLQIQQGSDLIKSGVSVIVICAINANSAGAIVREAHENGVQVLAYDRLILNCDLDYYVTYNSVKIGELMASYALKKQPKGNYLLFYGEATDMNAGFVKDGIFNILNSSINSGDINVLYQTYIEDWSGANAYNKMSKILAFSDQLPDVLISSYDGMSTQSIVALEEAGLAGKVLVTGQNGEIEAFQNIVSGKQTMTIYKPVKTLAEKSASVAWELATNRKTEGEQLVNNRRIMVKSTLLDAILVDKNNLKEEIIDKGIYSEEELSFAISY
jgi:D-xylose transport system substrate-binding protein